MEDEFLILYIIYTVFVIEIQKNIKNLFYKTYFTLVYYTYLDIIIKNKKVIF